MKRFNRSGFTFFELLVVLSIVAILLPLLAPSGLRVYHELQLRSAVQEIKSDLRLLQYKSLSTTDSKSRMMIFYRHGDDRSGGCPVYTIVEGDPFTPPVKRYQLPAIVKMQDFTFTDMHISFSQSGAPRPGGGTISFVTPEGTVGSVVVLPATGKIRAAYQHP